jgi:hypothetical protein
MSERYAFTPEEFGDAIRCFRITPRLTVKELCDMTGANEGRSRAMLETLGIAEHLRAGFGGIRKAYTLAPDYRQRMAARQRRQEARAAERGGRPTPSSRLAHLMGAQTWPTGDPTHFRTDWLGRVEYIGPVAKAVDPKWEFAAEDEQSC